MLDPDGTSWLLRSAAALDEGGCERIVVVLGAGAEEARALLADVPVDVIVAAGLGRRHVGVAARRAWASCATATPR